ncbi:MAG TPA: S8 family serine peptidase [Acidimicrobiales bacterium]|jgi:subtilisin family serine protease
MRLARTPLLLVLVAAAFLAAGEPAKAAPHDPGFGRQWALPLIGAEVAWGTGTGKGITIAVVDSGFYFEHEDFASGKVLPGRNFVEEGTPPRDDVGHGTHVAGIAAASTDNGLGMAGVAPDARILPVRVLEYDEASGSGTGTSDDVIAGIRWAVDNGAHIVNLSLGSDLQGILGPSFVSAVRYAWDHGVICVVAAGNSFVTGSGFRNESALVVSATDRSDRKPTYSSSVGEAKWGLAAPGGEGAEPNGVFSTYWTPDTGPGTYAYASGTSMAAPHVAGAAAILRGLGLTPQQTVDRLLSTAKDIGAAGPDSTFGHGRLDVAKAVSGLQPAGGTTTVTGTGTTTGGGSSATTAARRGTTTSTGARSGGNQTGGAPGAAGSPSTTATTAGPDPSLRIVPAGPEATPGPGDAAAGGQRGRTTSDDELPLVPPLLASGLLVAVSAGIVRVRRA